MKAAFFHEVTIFHPIRPLVKWSNEENRLARRNGGSKEVDAVMANDRFLVTAAIALMGFIVRPISKKFYGNAVDALQEDLKVKLTIVGSVMGHCAALRMQLSKLPS